MQNLTPAQLKVIQTWTETRDNLLREIGQYSAELEVVTKSTKEKGLALADLHQSIAEAKGRLAEVDALETRMRVSLPNDIHELEIRKSRLQSECAVLDETIAAGANKHQATVFAIEVLEKAHDVMKDQSAIVNRVVGEIIQTSQLHTSEMKTIMTEIKAISDQVVEKGNANVAQTNIILEKLPKYIFDLEKPIPVRSRYSTARGIHIPGAETQ